jgi:hypothetical protein
MSGIKRVDDAVRRATSGKKSARTGADSPRDKQIKNTIKKVTRPGILKHLGIK